MEEKNINLRVLIMKREGYWVAQCLEYDIVAQCAGTPDDIKNEFCRTLRVRVAACVSEGIDPFKLPKAPQIYHDLFERARLKYIDQKQDELDIPPAFMIKGFTSEIRYEL